jgi:catechol 2,3-dioxygenase-like lactoylglutathione lyase family enzyme
MATARTVQVTFDCADPARVGAFWADVLGYELDGSGVAATDPAGVGPRLYFQQVPEGKVVKNRVHLDVRVGTGLVGGERLRALQVEGSRLEALGATLVRLMPADGDEESCLVMHDVEGNEFCLD